jgi:hypothetical protein
MSSTGRRRALAVLAAVVLTSLVLEATQETLVIPASLDRDVPQLGLYFGPADLGVANTVIKPLRRAVALPPMGIEVQPAARSTRPVPPPDPRLRTTPARVLPVVVGPGRLSAVLAQLRPQLPGYDIWAEDGVINIAPADLRHDPAHFLNRPLKTFAVREMSFYRAVLTLLAELQPRIVPREWGEGAIAHVGGLPAPGAEELTRALFSRPVTLSVTDASPRQILNRLVALHGEMLWTARYIDSRPGAVPAPILENCQIEIFPAPPETLTRVMTLRPPSPPVSLPPSPAPVASPPQPPAPAGAPRVTVNLPVTPEGLTAAIVRLGAATRQALGVEVAGASTPPQASPSGERQFYDLTGLSVPEALDRLTGFAPEYAWTKDGDTFHIRPRALQATLLDQRVDRFTGRFENVMMAMTAVLAIWNPSQRPPPPGRFPPASWSDEAKALTQRLVEVDLANVTVRDILDEIARKHGAMSWAVTYRGSATVPGVVHLLFAGFDQWSTGSSTTIPR